MENFIIIVKYFHLQEITATTHPFCDSHSLLDLNWERSNSKKQQGFGFAFL